MSTDWDLPKVERAEGRLIGQLVEGRNWSQDAAGSIHDDRTAARLGFRGGTVAGSIHMDQFAPVLLDAYGEPWFERGWLSLYFQNATTDREPVRAYAQEPDASGAPIEAWMLRADGLEVMRGNAGLGGNERSALRTRDLRGSSSPSSLRILRRLAPDLEVGPFEVTLRSQTQRARLAEGLLSGPLPWFGERSPWGGPIAAPSTLVELLWRAPTTELRQKIGPAVGLFGAIEVAQRAGPVLLDRDYRVRARIVALGESPKTEFLWFDAQAESSSGPGASMRMLLRFMKASSPAYAE
jgi:hypothetical protein